LSCVQVDGGRAKESKLNEDASNTDDDDNDAVKESKMPADGKEYSKEDDDDWRLVPKLDPSTKGWQYVVKEDSSTEVRFALRLCHGSTLKIAFIPLAFSTSLMHVLVRTKGYSKSLFAL
jgi:hypothetical protein